MALNFWFSSPHLSSAGSVGVCCYTWLIEYLGLNTRPCACEAETLPTELYTLFYETGSLTGTKLISLARLADQQSYENLLVFVSSKLCPQWSGYRCVLPSLYVGAGCPNLGPHSFRANTLATEPSPQPHLTHKELLVIFYYLFTFWPPHCYFPHGS